MKRETLMQGLILDNQIQELKSEIIRAEKKEVVFVPLEYPELNERIRSYIIKGLKAELQTIEKQLEILK
jgi:hypothetical protein